MTGQFRVTPVDVVGSITKGAQARNALNQLTQTEQRQQAQNSLAKYLNDSGGLPETAAGRSEMFSTVAQHDIDIAERAQKIASRWSNEQFEENQRYAPLVRHILGEVKDGEDYAIALPILRQYPHFNDLPDQLDEQTHQQIGMMVQASNALFPDDPEQGYTLGTGQVRYNADNEVVAQGPEKTAKPPAPSNLAKLISERDALPQGHPNRAAYDAAINKTTSPSAPLVNMGAQETEEAKAFGKSLVANYDKVQERASVAQDTLAQIAIARSIPVQTGASAPLKSAIGAIAQGFGFAPESVGLDQASGAQALTAVMNNLVLNKMQAQKGPQTENDAARIEATLARLGNTPAANDFLFRSAEALEVRAVEQARFYRAHRQRTGSLDGAATAWDKYKRDTPLVGTHPETKQPVFYHEFESLVMRANRGATRQQILQLWRSKYDG